MSGFQATSALGAAPRTTNPKEEAVIGALGAASACLVSNPLDVARVRLQLARGDAGGPVGVLSSAVRREGLRALGSGLGLGITYNVLLNSTRFFLFSELNESGMPAPASGVVAGFVSGFISSPLARARTLVQTSRVSGRGGASAAALVFAPRAFQGATIWSLRNAGHTAIIFSLHGALKRRLGDAAPAASPTALHLVASVHAALVSCVVMNPVDVLATRFYCQPELRAVGSGVSVVASPAEVVWRTVAEEGLGGLFRGLSANVLRIVPHTAVTLAVADALRQARAERR